MFLFFPDTCWQDHWFYLFSVTLKMKKNKIMILSYIVFEKERNPMVALLLLSLIIMTMNTSFLFGELIMWFSNYKLNTPFCQLQSNYVLTSSITDQYHLINSYDTSCFIVSSLKISVFIVPVVCEFCWSSRFPLHRLVVSKVQALRRCVPSKDLIVKHRTLFRLSVDHFSCRIPSEFQSSLVWSQSLSSSSLHSKTSTCDSFFFWEGHLLDVNRVQITVSSM